LTFKKITLEDRSIIKAFEPYVTISDHSFTTLFAWSELAGFSYGIINNYLCIAGICKKGICIHAPIGKYDAKSYLQTMDELYSQFKKSDGSLHIIIAREQDVPQINALSGFEITGGLTGEERWDYIYNMDSFIKIEGKANHERRRLLRKLTSSHECECQEITKENVHICNEIMDDWCSRRECSQCTMGCEKKIIEKVVSAFEPLELSGCMTKIDGVPMSFALAEQIGNMAIIPFAKTAQAMDGLTDFTFSHLCENKYPDAEILNLCEDEGVEGLRRFKRRVGEFSQLKKYSYILKKSQ